MVVAMVSDTGGREWDLVGQRKREPESISLALGLVVLLGFTVS